MGHIVVMGRKTYESIGRPLPGRETLVISRSKAFQPPGVRVLHGVDELESATAGETRDVFICGGAEIYRQTLDRCSDLFLTLVHRDVEGDTHFPPFEGQFEKVIDLVEQPGFSISHYVNRRMLLAGGRR